MKTEWAVFARKHTNMTIYLACCIEAVLVEDRLVDKHREDGTWSIVKGMGPLRYLVRLVSVKNEVEAGIETEPGVKAEPRVKAERAL